MTTADEQEVKRCGNCNDVLTVHLSMDRVNAGIGGPRVFYRCASCEANRQLALTQILNDPDHLHAPRTCDLPYDVCAHGIPLGGMCLHCDMDQRQALEMTRGKTQGIEVVCIGCDKQLTEPGGILLSPPMHIAARSSVSKAHLCVECYCMVEAFLAGRLGAQ